ncbi:unnamed protein product [Phytophthora fragariaefolia]|uniref:Unnamed protein product n=1 Tax=Phytophthora fragariaefolia TaxID=1490495 RepID=A0A9W6UA04_9STRA|nr:unnamed protein product [Phytophthora fragariaefolia]
MSFHVYLVNDELEDVRCAADEGGELWTIVQRCTTDDRLLRDLMFVKVHRQVADARLEIQCVPARSEGPPASYSQHHSGRFNEGKKRVGRIPKEVLRRLPAQIDPVSGKSRNLCMRYLTKAGCVQDGDGGYPSEHGHFCAHKAASDPTHLSRSEGLQTQSASGVVSDADRAARDPVAAKDLINSSDSVSTVLPKLDQSDLHKQSTFARALVRTNTAMSNVDKITCVQLADYNVNRTYLIVDADILDRWPEVICSPIGAVEKKGVNPPEEARRIHDLSYPKGDSVNAAFSADSVPKLRSKVEYRTVHCIYPRNKIVKARDRVLAGQQRGNASKSELFKLMGSHHHGATCLRTAKPFYQRLQSQCTSVPRFSRVQLSARATEVQAWFQHILSHGCFAELPLALFGELPKLNVELYMDASNIGLAVLDPACNSFLQIKFNAEEKSLIDQVGSDQDESSIIVREHMISADHIPGATNWMADAASRAWAEPFLTRWTNFASSWMQTSMPQDFLNLFNPRLWPRRPGPSMRAHGRNGALGASGCDLLSGSEKTLEALVSARPLGTYCWCYGWGNPGVRNSASTVLSKVIHVA